MLLGAIEAGGTKFRCAVSRGLNDVVATERFATTTPGQTFDQVIEFFESCQQRHGALDAFGVASFGPVDLDIRSSTYGHLLATPKAGWSHYDLRARLLGHFNKPIYLDTDVNAAALAEWHQDAHRGTGSLVYVTVGTGIGGGAVFGGKTLHGLWHSEMGHIGVRRHPSDLKFPGACPFHRDCLEGLASGSAIVARWHKPMSALVHDQQACSIIGSYLGQMAANAALMLTPQKIVFGGGVMSDGALLPYIRRSTREQLAGYLPHARLAGTLEDFITAPALEDRSGICGAILLAAMGMSAIAIPQ